MTVLADTWALVDEVAVGTWELELWVEGFDMTMSVGWLLVDFLEGETAELIEWLVVGLVAVEELEEGLD
jgi:hypothetical protein